MLNWELDGKFQEPVILSSSNKLKTLHIFCRSKYIAKVQSSVPFQNTFSSSYWKVDASFLEMVSLSNIKKRHLFNSSRDSTKSKIEKDAKPVF